MKDIIRIDGPFKFYVQRTMPLVFDDSLSYYEVLCKLTEQINKIIKSVNNNAEVSEELQDLFVELKKYVDDYFSDLGIQTEINNKLDQMAEDGTLDQIININIFNDLNNDINNLDNKLDTKINTEIGTLDTKIDTEVSILQSEMNKIQMDYFSDLIAPEFEDNFVRTEDRSLQGGTVTPDYIFYAMYTDNANTKIRRIKRSDYTVTDYNLTDKHHCNGMTYNKHNDNIYIAYTHGSNDTNFRRKIGQYDTNMNLIGVHEIEYNISNITYNKKDKQFIAQNATNKNNFHFYDDEFNFIETRIAKNIGTLYSQDLSCDGDYLYLSDFSDMNNNIIIISLIDMTIKQVVGVADHREIEFMEILDDDDNIDGMNCVIGLNSNDHAIIYTSLKNQTNYQTNYAKYVGLFPSDSRERTFYVDRNSSLDNRKADGSQNKPYNNMFYLQRILQKFSGDTTIYVSGYDDFTISLWNISGFVTLIGNIKTLNLRHSTGNIKVQNSTYESIDAKYCSSVEIHNSTFKGGTTVGINVVNSRLLISNNCIFTGTYSNYGISLVNSTVKLNNILNLNNNIINNNCSTFGCTSANINTGTLDDANNSNCVNGYANLEITSWNQPTLSSVVSNNALSTAGPIVYRSVNGKTQIKGSFKLNNTSSGDKILFTLPNKFKSLTRHDFIVVGSANTSITLFTRDNGEIMINSASTYPSTWFNIFVEFPNI